MNDAAQVFGGAGGGILFTTLYDCLKELISKCMLYKSLLKTIICTLDSCKPLIKQIDESNEELGFATGEVEKFKSHMEKGIEIVKKCSKVSRWKPYNKYKYARKFIAWDGDLRRHLDILNLQGVRDGKKTLVSVKGIQKSVNRIEVDHTTFKMDLKGIATTNGNMEKLLTGIKRDSFHIQKSVNQTLEGIKRIESKGTMPNGNEVVRDVPALPAFTVGLDVPLKELKMKLLQNDQVSMLVVTAPGGCGKTTLATKFCQDEEVQGKFKNNIIFITVSKTRNLDSIVRELYDRKGSQIPAFHDEETAVEYLHKFLKEEGQNPLLMVLDDVWSGSESLLESFESFEFKMPDYKILVTSRSEFRGFGSSYPLQLLKFDNAMKLFHHSASLGDKSKHIPSDISSKIVEGCKGFPLAIRVAGRSLCGQPTEIWQERLIKWSRGSSILDNETQVLLRLQSSLDTSTKEMALVKECFLDLGSFPEDQRIPVAALIDIWAESYDLLDEDILCVANLHKLTNRSLATLVVTRKDQMEGEGDGYYSEHFVTQHDLLRELAIYETKQEDKGHRERLVINICGDNFPKWWREQKYQSMKARLVSISTDGNFSTKWHNMELPETEVLVLNFQTDNYRMPEFVEKMDKLKVLVLTNYGFLRSELTNFQFLQSSSNLKRIRLERISIPSITKNPLELKALQKISLFMCTIGQAFNNGCIQFSDAFPKLVEVNIDYCNDLVELPADVCDLIHIKKLSVTNCHKFLALPEDLGKLANLEVLRLKSCTDLAKLPASSGKLKKVNFLDISYCFSIKELPEDIGGMSNLRTLNMIGCSRMQDLPESILDLEQLKKVICDDETESLWEPFLPLENTTIVVAEENVNLNWLHDHKLR